MQLAFGFPWVLLALPPIWGLVWWWYRRRKPPLRPIAGLWLWQQAQRKAKARRRFDWRLFLLLLAAAFGVCGLSLPRLSLQLPGALVLVLDTSASMSATDLNPSRLEQAKALAKPYLERSPQAVLVIAGDRTESFGPTVGAGLVPNLSKPIAQSKTADLETALARGRALLPQAKTLVISDAAPPSGADAYINVAGNGQNIGITAVAPGFVALANSGPGRWEGEVSVEGKAYKVAVPAGGFTTLEVPQTAFSARIAGSDVLSLDNQARFNRRQVRVGLSDSAPALERLLLVLGTSRAEPTELGFELGTPKQDPNQYTVYFANQTGALETVYDLERSQSVLQGVDLVGFSLPLAPSPKGRRWQPLATSADGKALAWYQANGLYLPPLESLQNLPAFPVLIYNLIAPRSEVRQGLLTPQESLLPRPQSNIPLPPALTLNLLPWLVLLMGLVLLLEYWLFGRSIQKEGLLSNVGQKSQSRV